jgi:predicted metal-dependent HD superfamily phosphohydrolase
MLNLDRLYQRWQKYYLLIPVSSNTRTQDSVFAQLVDAYSQPDRHYHNLTHIDCVLMTIERFSELQNPRAVYLAAWFHDFIYDSRASDNEAKSVVVARDMLTNLGESIATIDRVEQLILATQGHQIDPDDRDRCIFLDADLAILGADPVRYQAYQQAIRCEYSWVSDRDYRAGRTRVLQGFLHRDRLYYTELLFTELESIARLNLAQEIASIEQLS